MAVLRNVVQNCFNVDFFIVDFTPSYQQNYIKENNAKKSNMCIYEKFSHIFYYFQIQVTCHVGGFKKNDNETMPKRRYVFYSYSELNLRRQCCYVRKKTQLYIYMYLRFLFSFSLTWRFVLTHADHLMQGAWTMHYLQVAPWQLTYDYV